LLLMTKPAIRILLLADTHLGFDAPLRPRVERRRRGPDFFSNYERTLRLANRGEVDLVVHGGDLFFRRRVSPLLVEQALKPLAEVAQKGVPVFLVPENREGSRIPLHLATATPNLTIFHQPDTFVLELAGASFPFTRKVGVEIERLTQAAIG
jgi:metallophosphoesterase superfamily enzyme